MTILGIFYDKLGDKVLQISKKNIIFARFLKESGQKPIFCLLAVYIINNLKPNFNYGENFFLSKGGTG